MSGDGNTLVVGSEHGLNSKSFDSGIVRTFERRNNKDGAVWEEGTTMEPMSGPPVGWWSAPYQFGETVDISDDGSIVAVGSTSFGANSVGHNTNYKRGRAFLFRKDSSGNWTELAFVDWTSRSDMFGHCVAINEQGTLVAAGTESIGTDTDDYVLVTKLTIATKCTQHTRFHKTPNTRTVGGTFRASHGNRFAVLFKPHTPLNSSIATHSVITCPFFRSSVWLQGLYIS